MLIARALKNGKKVVLFGNGGSAADAQHIACELAGRFKLERRGLPAIALTTNTSTITAIANDYGYDKVFSRQVEAIVDKGDIVIGISTSGKSPNVIEGVKAAKEHGAITVGLTGAEGGRLEKVVDICIKVPSDDTPRIQETHITIGHIICQLVEESLS
jgi:D-sedoheptulose 7-phosphate isomerase